MKTNAKVSAGVGLLGLAVGAYMAAKYKDGKLGLHAGGEAGKGADTYEE